MNVIPQGNPEEPEENNSNLPPTSSEESRQENPFTLENLRLNQDFTTSNPVRKLITTVSCRKPAKQAFVRTRQGEEWKFKTAIFKDEVNNEMYLVHHNLQVDLANEITPYCLYTSITKQGDLFLWPVRLPDDEGRPCAWHVSALRAAIQAQTQWIRVASNMNAGHYDTYAALGNLSEPDWPDIEFEELLGICFQDRYIKDMDHPVLRSLRGEL